MRISDSNPIDSASGQSQSSSVRGVAQSGDEPNNGTATAASGNDQVALSGVSQLLRTSASGREQRLASLAAVVRAGQYQVPAASIARAITSETLARSARV